MDTFTSIGQRKINIDGFSNQDTLSKVAFEYLQKSGTVEVYTEEGINMYLKKINAEIEKSEDSEKEILKKGINDEISSLHKHRVEGKIVFFKMKKSDTLQKSEEVIKLEVNDIIKSNITDAFNYGSLSKIEFSRKGVDIKSDIASAITNLAAEKEDIKTKMSTLVGTLPIKPDQPCSDYQYKGMKDQVGTIYCYPYNMCYYNVSTTPVVNSYDNMGVSDQTKVTIPVGPESAAQAQMYDMYNDLAYQYISRCVDIEYLTLFANNLDDKKNYSLTVPQMMDLGINKAEENDIEKGGEGSKGGKIIGHTRSGKPIYQTSHKENVKNFSDKDHTDAHNLYQKHSFENHKVKNQNKTDHFYDQAEKHKPTEVDEKDNDKSKKHTDKEFNKKDPSVK